MNEEDGWLSMELDAKKSHLTTMNTILILTVLLFILGIVFGFSFMVG